MRAYVHVYIYIQYSLYSSTLLKLHILLVVQIDIYLFLFAGIAALLDIIGSPGKGVTCQGVERDISCCVNSSRSFLCLDHAASRSRGRRGYSDGRQTLRWPRAGRSLKEGFLALERIKLSTDKA